MKEKLIDFVKWVFGCACAWGVFAGLLTIAAYTSIPSYASAAFILPFCVYALAVTFLNPAKKAVQRYMPAGKVKRLLLVDVN